MRTRLAGALALLLILPSCKKDRDSNTPDSSTSSSSSRRVAKRGVKPLEICEHLANMAAAEVGLREPPIDEQLMNECESELTIEAGIRGTDNWNEFGSCVLDSRDQAELEHCNRSYPMPGQVAVVASDGSRELEVCEHMIEVLMLENAAETGEVPTLTPDERAAVVEECARSFVAEQKPTRSDGAYHRMLDCIELAQSSEHMRACE